MISDCLPHQVQRLHDELAHASSKHRQLTAHAQAAEATFAERVRNSHAEQEEPVASHAPERSSRHPYYVGVIKAHHNA